ncbi:hypothetical protein ACP4OV_019320 [Aristida adscensionis]
MHGGKEFIHGLKRRPLLVILEDNVVKLKSLSGDPECSIEETFEDVVWYKIIVRGAEVDILKLCEFLRQNKNFYSARVVRFTEV